MQFDLWAGRFRELCAGNKRFCPRVVQFTGLFFHHKGKHVVGRFQNFGAGAEILRQQQLARLTRVLLAERRIGVVFGKEDRWVGQSEPVD